MALPDLPDVKAHLGIKTAVDDTELQTFLDAAVARLGHEVGPLVPISVVERHTGPGPLMLRETPVVSVQSVTQTGTTVLAADLDLDLETGILHGASGYRFNAGRRAVTVAYTAGYDTLPADLRQAVRELVRHLWATQRGAARGGARADLIGQGGDEPTTVAGRASYTLPRRVLELIRPYQRSNQVA